MKAVISISGKQYFVSEKDTIIVEKINKKEGEKFNISDVFLIVNNGKIILGQPKIKKTFAEAEVLKHKKAPKIKILKFRSKTGYKRLKGHRQKYTEIKILKIKPLK